jgi:tetratricopeptide (TPR) repeat protein
MPRLWGDGVVLVAVLLAVADAHAAPLDKAKAAIEQSDYFSARSALDEALRSGTNNRDELAEIYRLSGYVSAALGDTVAATTAFERCLALAPNSALPAGTSPRIVKAFTTAQDTFKTKKPLEIKTATTPDPPTVTIEVVNDPLTMIAKLQAIVVVDGKPEQKIDKPTAATVTIELPKGKRIDLRVAAIDEHGNHLRSARKPSLVTSASDPRGRRAGPKPIPKPGKPYAARPLYLQWWLWGGAAVAVLGAGSYFGIEAVRAKGDLVEINAESSNHQFAEAQAIESDARRSVLLANIGWIAGGAPPSPPVSWSHAASNRPGGSWP